MRKYFRLMLGEGSKYVNDCLDGSYVGVDFNFNEDLKPYLVGSWADHKSDLKNAFIKHNPGKTPVGLGLAAGTLSSFGQWIERGDVVLCPDGKGGIYVGEVVSDYFYLPGNSIPHRREVKWMSGAIQRSDLSESLQASTRGPNTLVDITKFSEEIERLVGNRPADILFSKDVSVEDPSAFALEKHLEDFLVFNWSQTELARKYDLVTDEGVVVAQQYQSDTGPIDILAISKDKKEYLVIELKKGRASDVVVGQILRYMGFVKNELAVNGEQVKGIVIALDDDLRLRNAISMVSSVEFYRYEINFKLLPASTK